VNDRSTNFCGNLLRFFGHPNLFIGKFFEFCLDFLKDFLIANRANYLEASFGVRTESADFCLKPMGIDLGEFVREIISNLFKKLFGNLNFIRLSELNFKHNW
jgi:hypothetical protein